MDDIGRKRIPSEGEQVGVIRWHLLTLTLPTMILEALLAITQSTIYGNGNRHTDVRCSAKDYLLKLIFGSRFVVIRKKREIIRHYSESFGAGAFSQKITFFDTYPQVNRVVKG